MGEFKIEAVVVLLFLLPGFLASRLKQHLTVNREQSELDKIVEALLYSFIIYTTFSFVAKSLPVALDTETKGPITEYSLRSNRFQLLLLTTLAFLVALAMSYAANHDIWGRFFRWIKATNRSWRDTIWSDVFHNFGGAVQVELSDSRIVMGWLKYFSDRPGDSSLFLEKAAWVTADFQVIPITGPGIFLTKDSGIRSISFLKWQQTDQVTPSHSSFLSLFLRSSLARFGAAAYLLLFVAASLYPLFDHRTFSGLIAVTLAWPWVDYHPATKLFLGFALLNSIIIYSALGIVSVIMGRKKKMSFAEHERPVSPLPPSDRL
jgi:hypothetical protein